MHAGCEPDSFDGREPGGEANGESRNVKADDERELDSREDDGIEFHRMRSPEAPVPARIVRDLPSLDTCQRIASPFGPIDQYYVADARRRGKLAVHCFHYHSQAYERWARPSSVT